MIADQNWPVLPEKHYPPDGALMFDLYNTYGASVSSGQADGINQQFLDAMTWMKNNTPANATAVAVWPDGSVIEAWANRTSLMDSVGADRIKYKTRLWVGGAPPRVAALAADRR